MTRFSVLTLGRDALQPGLCSSQCITARGTRYQLVPGPGDSCFGKFVAYKLLQCGVLFTLKPVHDQIPRLERKLSIKELASVPSTIMIVQNYP